MLKSAKSNCFVLFGLLWLILVFFYITPVIGRNSALTGQVELDEQWERVIYLSYIGSFDEMHAMSHDMIIASAPVDSLGRFQFDLSFLPAKTHMYRLHLRKKDDNKTTLIIGGREENYTFFFAERNQAIHLSARGILPPFGRVFFDSPGINQQFQQIRRLISKTDSIAMESSSMKRSFILKKLDEELLMIADTASRSLLAAYAFHKAKIGLDDPQFQNFADSYRAKWSENESSYDQFLRKTEDTKVSFWLWLVTIGLSAMLLLLTGFWLGRLQVLRKGRQKVHELSLQERKVFELLQKSASNKDISDELNIGLSTVKSHVSSILSKMKVKSRKELAKFE